MTYYRKTRGEARREDGDVTSSATERPWNRLHRVNVLLDNAMMLITTPYLFPDAPKVWSQDEVLLEPECLALIERFESDPHAVVLGGGEFRNQDRIAFDDEDLADRVYRRLTLPAALGPLEPRGCNSHLRMYRYRPGQEFAEHTDHWFQPSGDRLTVLTVVLYLNEGFEGGSTSFKGAELERLLPARGRAGIWQHKVPHSGERVKRGTKYVLRTDVYYGKPGAVVLVDGGVPSRPAA